MATAKTFDAFLRAFATAFPMPPIDPETPPPPLIAKAQALREGAQLSERVDAVSRKRAR